MEVGQEVLLGAFAFPGGLPQAGGNRVHVLDEAVHEGHECAGVALGHVTQPVAVRVSPEVPAEPYPMTHVLQERCDQALFLEPVDLLLLRSSSGSPPAN